MRWMEINESVKTYLPMFNGFNVGKAIKNHIETAERMYKRKDRIIWALRYIRAREAVDLNLLNNLGDNSHGSSDKVIKKAFSAIGANSAEEADRLSDQYLVKKETLKHYLDLNLPKINEIVWDKQTPRELEDAFRTIEYEWQRTLSQMVTIEDGDEKLIDFRNGWVWWKLNRGSCTKEASAMGHCGNAGGRYSDRILSLRKHIKDEYWEPHLTFIINPEGYLGEMKGKNNDKPVERYHPYIIALLKKKDVIKGITGGGYLPENNFDINDLDETEQRDVKDANPALLTIHDIYYKWKDGDTTIPDELVERMLWDDLKKHGFQFTKIDMENEVIIIDNYKDMKTYSIYNYDYASRLYEKLFDDSGSRILEILVDHGLTGMSFDTARAISYEVVKDYSYLLYECLGRGIHYDLDIGFRTGKEGSFSSVLSFSDYISTDFEDEYSHMLRTSDLDHASDYFEDDDIPHEVDDIALNMLEYVNPKNRDQKNVYAQSLAEAIKEKYDHMITSGAKPYGTPTIDDPNQHKLKF